MKKHITKLILSIVALLVALPMLFPIGVQAKFEKTFPDVKNNSANFDTTYNDINNLLNLGIIGGFPDGTFQPNRNLTRGEMSKFVRKAFFGENFIDESCSQFKDVPKSNTFYTDILTLKCQGVVSGFGDNLFKPENNVSRGEALKFVVEGLYPPTQITGQSPVSPEFVSLNKIGESEQNPAKFQLNQKFEDVPKGSSFYDYAYSFDVFDLGDFEIKRAPGQLSTLKVNDKITRSEMAQLVHRTLFASNLNFISTYPEVTSKFVATNKDISYKTNFGQIGGTDDDFYYNVPGVATYLFVYGAGLGEDIGGLENVEVNISNKNLVFDKLGFNPTSDAGIAKPQTECGNCGYALDPIIKDGKNLTLAGISNPKNVNWKSNQVYNICNDVCGFYLSVVLSGTFGVSDENTIVKLSFNKDARDLLTDKGITECGLKNRGDNAFSDDIEADAIKRKCVVNKAVSTPNKIDDLKDSLAGAVEKVNFEFPF